MYLVTALMMAEFAKAQSYVPEWNDTRLKVKAQTEIKAYAFDLKDVQLLESPFKHTVQVDTAYCIFVIN
jgi:hypothetical protein